MQTSILFLVTCIISARLLERRRMRVAAVFYSVMFITVFSYLLLATELGILRVALTNLLGAQTYELMHNVALDAMNESYFGVTIAGILFLTIGVQVALAVLEAASAAVRCIRAFARRRRGYKFRKAYFKLASSVRKLVVHKRINLIYCRLLN